MQGCGLRYQMQEYDAWLNIYIQMITLGSKNLAIIYIPAFGTNIFVYMKSSEK